MNYSEADNSESSEPQEVAAFPDGLERRIAEGGVRVLDVRPIFEAGQEPFQTIMQAVDQLTDGEVFKLLAPFEPVPLYALLARKGFSHCSRSMPGGSWKIFFYRESEEPGEAAVAAPGEDDFSSGDSDDAMVELDVRGLEPPEPLERVMSAAEQLAYGGILKVRHHREPLILFDVLAERGFAYRSEPIHSEEWEIRIWLKG